MTGKKGKGSKRAPWEPLPAEGLVAGKFAKLVEAGELQGLLALFLGVLHGDELRCLGCLGPLHNLTLRRCQEVAHRVRLELLEVCWMDSRPKSREDIQLDSCTDSGWTSPAISCSIQRGQSR